MLTPPVTRSQARSRFLKYALGLTSVSAATSATAGIVVWDAGSATGSGLPLTTVGLSFSPATGVTANSAFTEALSLTSSSSLFGNAASGYSFLGPSAFAFYNFGEAIDGAQGKYSYVNSSSAVAGTRYIGFAIESGPDFQYGWAAIEWNNMGVVSLTSFAYETDLNTAISAGAVPEPASAAMALAAGAVGFAALRRRQRQDVTAS